MMKYIETKEDFINEVHRFIFLFEIENVSKNPAIESQLNLLKKYFDYNNINDRDFNHSYLLEYLHNLYIADKNHDFIQSSFSHYLNYLLSINQDELKSDKDKDKDKDKDEDEDEG